MNVNDLDNGTYIKAKICGVSEPRVVPTKDKQTGAPVTLYFYSLVVEESLTGHKKLLQFDKQATEESLHNKLSDPRIIGKTALIPIYCSAYNGRVDYHYSGSEMPYIVPETTKASG